MAQGGYVHAGSYEADRTRKGQTDVREMAIKTEPEYKTDHHDKQ